MDGAVRRYCAAVEAGDMTALAATLAPEVQLPSRVIGSAVFKGRLDVTRLLTAVYAMLHDVRWKAPVGEGRTRLAIAEATWPSSPAPTFARRLRSGTPGGAAT